MGGIFLALAYGVLGDSEDKIVTDFAMVSAEEWLTLLMLGGMGLISFFALTRSLLLIPPTTVAVVRAMEIVLAYGVQGAVLEEVGVVNIVCHANIILVLRFPIALLWLDQPWSSSAWWHLLPRKSSGRAVPAGSVGCIELRMSRMSRRPNLNKLIV